MIQSIANETKNNTLMKTIKLSILFIAQALFFSCSEQGVYTDGASKQIIERNEKVTQAIDRLTPGCKLLVEIDKKSQDTVLERLALNIARNWYDHRKGLSLPLINSTIKFVPVINSPMTRLDIDDSKEILQIHNEFACFYGQNDKGEIIYFYALYNDRSNFTKDTKPKAYEANVELFGQEFADKVVRQTRNAKGTERWEIIVVSQQDPAYKKFEDARNYSDDGTFFVLARGKNYPKICFFKDKKPYYCCEIGQTGLDMEPLENYLKR